MDDLHGSVGSVVKHNLHLPSLMGEAGHSSRTEAERRRVTLPALG